MQIVEDHPRPIGIALSSGGASALTQIGVLETLGDAGLPIERVAGTSAGAIIGSVFAAGQLIPFRDAMVAFTWRRIFGLFNLVWPRGSFLEFHSALEFMKSFVPDAVESLSMPFAAVAVDLISGEEVSIVDGAIADAVRASCAIPGLFPPCRRAGRWLADGALVNPLPVNAARRLGSAFVVAVNVLPGDAVQASAFRLACDARLSARVRDWIGAHLPGREAPFPTVDVSPLRVGGVEAGAPDSSDPRLFAVLAAASRIVQCRLAIARLRDEPADFLINVPAGDVGIFDFHRATDLIEMGRKAAVEALPDLERALARRAPAHRRMGRWLRNHSSRPTEPRPMLGDAIADTGLVSPRP